MPTRTASTTSEGPPGAPMVNEIGVNNGRAAIVLAVAAALAAFNLLPLAFGIDAVLARIPDDAFYYLVLAKNFAVKGFWTFDGTHAATGFHPLYGYMLAGLYALFPSISFPAIYVLTVIVNVALIGFSLYMLMQAAQNAGLAKGVIGVVLVALSPASFRIAGYPMESALAVFFGSAAMLLATPAAASRRWAPHAAFATGLIAVLARSDLGALPFALIAGALGLMVLTRAFDRRLLAVLALMCAGAVCGEVLIAAHTHYFTGGFVQRSASIKLLWAKASGPTPFPGLARIAELMGPHFVPRPLILAALGVAAAYVIVRGKAIELLAKPLVAGALITCAGYVTVYAMNGSVQYWYAANFFPAAAVLAAALWATLAGHRPMVARSALALFLASSVYQQMNPPWPWQKASREAGAYLAAHPEIGPVGAWNAGITGYYAGRPVINLDGLVNDDVYEYVAQNRFAHYLRDRRIAYLTDFPAMLDEGAAHRGGYRGANLAACVKTLMPFSPETPMNGNAYSLMQVDEACIRQSAR